MAKFFVSICGNIGSGKTTLTSLLSEKLGWVPVYEEFAQNPYLDKFYEDMRRWGFHSQIFFLTQRLKQYNELKRRRSHILQDRTIYEDAEIFARNLFNQGNIPEEDYEVYRQLYESIVDIIPPPDLILYLKASVPVLKKRIKKRGRKFEQHISSDYLKKLNSLYEDWINHCELCPILTIETDNVNFAEDEKALSKLTRSIHRRLKAEQNL